MKKNIFIIVIIIVIITACQEPKSTQVEQEQAISEIIQPKYITDTTQFDTDDPAIWVHPTDPSKSLIVGTDKNKEGGLYVYDLKGTIVNKTEPLQRPNNVDIEYGFQIGDSTVDIAVTTERLTHKLRVFKLPEMTPIDKGGIEVFIGETEEEFRALMGISLYKNPETGTIQAIVGRKKGPTEDYLWQYELSANNAGEVEAKLVRKFGKFSQKKEIEAICVDDKMGYVYYSDEGVGVRKYYANPEKGNEEISLFAHDGFMKDHEGISIYPTSDSTGYLFVSDQEANYFRIYKREGDNEFIKSLPFATDSSDGSELSPVSFNEDFKKGLFVAMSEGKVFHIYDWETIEKRIKE